MNKTVLYKYLGTNGTIISPVHLEDIYYIRLIKLDARKGFQLTKDNVDFYQTVTIPEDEVNDWSEVKGQE